MVLNREKFMLCVHCETPLEKNYKYCPNCGTCLLPAALTDSYASMNENEQEPESQPQKTVKKRPMPLWFKLVLLVAVLSLMGVTAGILFTEKLVDVVDKQLAALAKNDIQKAYYDYSSKHFQRVLSFDQF